MTKQIPTLAVVLVVGGGLFATAVLHTWRVGSGIIGLGFCLAAALRLTLPSRQAGLLAVRSRGVDAAVLLVLGLTVVALANAIPVTS